MKSPRFLFDAFGYLPREEFDGQIPVSYEQAVLLAEEREADAELDAGEAYWDELWGEAA